MTREDAIKIIKSATVYTPKEIEALETLVPGFTQSEDDRVLNALITHIRIYEGDFTTVGITRSEILDYLEKKKEQKSRIDACGFPLRDEGESACSYLERCLSPDMRNIWYEACSEIKEKQKEQKFVDDNQEFLKGLVRIRDDKTLTEWEKKFDDIADKYAHNKNKEGYNESWYTKERAAEMLHFAKKELEQKSAEIDFEDWDTLGYIRDIVRKHVKKDEDFNILDKWLIEHYLIHGPAECLKQKE